MRPSFSSWLGSSGADRHFGAALGIVGLYHDYDPDPSAAHDPDGRDLPVLSRIAAETSRGVGSGVGALMP